MGEGSLRAELLQVFGLFGLGFGLGASNDRRQPLKELDVLRTAAVADSLAPDIGDDAGGARQAPARVHDKHAFGMFGGEAAASGGRARLEEQGSALGRRLRKVRSGYVEVLAHMVDGVDLGRVGIDAALGVAQHGVVLPTGLPQLVDYVEILVGQVVPLVVRRQPVEAEIQPGVGQIGCHDVPRHSPPGQMVQRRHLPGKGEGVTLQDRAGECEAQILGGIGHGRDQHGRIIDRGLHPFDDRRFGAAAVRVVDSYHIGQEKRVEAALLQYLGQFHPRV